MAMGFALEESIPPAEVEILRGTNPVVSRPEAPVYYGDGCFRGCNRGSVDAGPG